MKIKETNKTAHIAWSPFNVYPCMLACGTAAQQLDASFRYSTFFFIALGGLQTDRIFCLVRISKHNVMLGAAQLGPVKYRRGIQCVQIDSNGIKVFVYQHNYKWKYSHFSPSNRFNKLLWTEYLNNVIIGGCEDGSVYLYDCEKMLGDSQTGTSLLNKLVKHTGVVAALDINPFQSNLLASGAGSSEIFIWDLNNPSVPMTPGAKTPVQYTQSY